MKKIIIMLMLSLSGITYADSDAFTVWSKTGDHEIQMIASDIPCKHHHLVEAGYQFAISSAIPIGRLKNKDDAYFTYTKDDAEYAATVTGCWSPAMHKVYWHRKHDGKEWEERFKVDDSWVREVVGGESTSQDKAKHTEEVTNIANNGNNVSHFIYDIQYQACVPYEGSVYEQYFDDRIDAEINKGPHFIETIDGNGKTNDAAVYVIPTFGGEFFLYMKSTYTECVELSIAFKSKKVNLIF